MVSTVLVQRNCAPQMKRIEAESRAMKRLPPHSGLSTVSGFRSASACSCVRRICPDTRHVGVRGGELAIDRRFAGIVAREAVTVRDSEKRHRRLYEALQRETVEREHAERFRLIVEAAPNAMDRRRFFD